MIQVTIGSNLDRKKIVIPATTTIRSVLEDNDIEYMNGTMHLDGCALKAGDFDKTFADFGITESCYLTSVIKADNA